MLTRRAYRQLTMGTAVLLSLAVHGWVLLQPVPAQPITAEQAAAGIALEIVHPAAPVPSQATPAAGALAVDSRPPATAAVSRAAKNRHPIPVPAPAPAPAPHAPAADVSSLASTNHIPSKPVAMAAVTATSDNQLLLARIKTDLARHFHYPHIARQRGWEGEVILGFVVHPDGRITTIKILKSSGFMLLDQAARQSLAQVERLQLASRYIAGTSQLELPVQYRLTGS